MSPKSFIFVFITHYLSNSKSCRLQYPAIIVIWPKYFYFCFVCFNINFLIDRLKECSLKYGHLSSKIKYKLPLSSFTILSH